MRIVISFPFFARKLCLARTFCGGYGEQNLECLDFVVQLIKVPRVGSTSAPSFCFLQPYAVLLSTSETSYARASLCRSRTPQAIFLLHPLSSDGKECTDLLSDQTGRAITSILGGLEAFIQIMLIQDNLDEETYLQAEGQKFPGLSQAATEVIFFKTAI